jgi:hypothetical protein
MAQVFSQAYGYNFFFMPLKKENLNFAQLATFAGFMTLTSPLSNTAAVTKTGTGSTLAISVGATSLALDGTGAPIRLLGLTNAAPSETETEETVVTYDDEVQSFDTSIATGKSFSFALEGVTDHNDAAYKLMRLCAKESVREGLMVKYARIGPQGFTERTYGFGRFTGFEETPPAGGIVRWKTTLKAYGPYELDFHVPPAPPSGGGGGGG